MAGPVDAFLKLSIAISLLGAAASVGYYYSVYLPARDAQVDRERKLDAARAEYSRQAEQARTETQKREVEAKEAAAREATQGRYLACIHIAESNYSGGWADQCKRNADKTAKNRKDCISTGSTKDTCDMLWAADSSPSCTLPRGIGTDLNEELDKSRKRCLEESRAGLQ